MLPHMMSSCVSGPGTSVLCRTNQLFLACSTRPRVTALFNRRSNAQTHSVAAPPRAIRDCQRGVLSHGIGVNGFSAVVAGCSSNLRWTAPKAFNWKAALIALGVGGCSLAILMILQKNKDKELDRKKRERVGKSLIGGDWQLLNHDGQLQSNKDYLGNWLLIYFGFTHCPDICPDELEKMCQTAEILSAEKNVHPIIPMFFSVDPTRDTVENVKKYVRDFSPKLIGFTGSKEQVDKVTKTFRVYHSEGPKDQFNDYIVDHTVIMYLLDPEGRFVDYYGQNRTAQEVADAISLQQMRYDKAATKTFWR